METTLILGLSRGYIGIMENKLETTIVGLSYPELARNEGMDPYSSPYMTLYSSFHFLFHSFIPS